MSKLEVDYDYEIQVRDQKIAELSHKVQETKKLVHYLEIIKVRDEKIAELESKVQEIKESIHNLHYKLALELKRRAIANVLRMRNQK